MFICDVVSRSSRCGRCRHALPSLSQLSALSLFVQVETYTTKLPGRLFRAETLTAGALNDKTHCTAQPGTIMAKYSGSGAAASQVLEFDCHAVASSRAAAKAGSTSSLQSILVARNGLRMERVLAPDLQRLYHSSCSCLLQLDQTATRQTRQSPQIRWRGGVVSLIVCNSMPPRYWTSRPAHEDASRRLGISP